MTATASRPAGAVGGGRRDPLSGVTSPAFSPIDSGRSRRSGSDASVFRSLPLEAEERASTLANLAAIPLVFKIREACDGPVLLLKGPEVGALYPRGGRRFGDVDVLTPFAQSVQESLLANGFMPGEPDFDMSDGLHHHLEPVRWPTIALNVEVQLGTELASAREEATTGGDPRGGRPLRPPGTGRLGAPPTPPRADPQLARMATRAAPPDPGPARHRSGLDGLDAGELDRLAAKWGMTKIWSTTTATIEALFYGGRKTVPLRSWARHLEEIRPRTVFENHLQRWVGAFWEEPPGPALARLGHELRDDIRPDAGDTWGTKLGRVGRAVVNPRRRVALREPAAGSAERPPETDD